MLEAMRATALVICLALAGCSSGATSASPPAAGPAQAATTVSPTVTVRPSASPSAAKTLEEATAVAQEMSDRFSSGDYRLLLAGISRTDYATLGKTCNGANGLGLKIATTGVRMEGENQAIVRLELMGVQQTRTMSYEDGRWGQEPSPEFAPQLGRPVADIIAAQKASGGCKG